MSETETVFPPFDSHAYEGNSVEVERNGIHYVATIYRDDSGDTPEQRDEGFWPSNDPHSAGYVLPENYESEMAKAQAVMESWNQGEWFYCGVAVTAYVTVPSPMHGDNGVHKVQLIPRFQCALWGVECNYPDSGNSYLQEVANELLSEAEESAHTNLKLITEVQGKE